MSTVASELAYWVAAARGAIEWHLEGGDTVFDVPPDFRLPALGRAELVPYEGPPPARQEVPAPAQSGQPHGLPPAHALPQPEAAPQVQPTVPQDAPQQPTSRLSVLSEATGGKPRQPAPPVAQTAPAAPTTAQRPALTQLASGGLRANAAAQLQTLREALGDCRRCGLCEAREEIVFGHGDPAARLMFVAEGPGAKEDVLGLPFVDPAGELLSKMIRAMGFRRDTVYLSYVTKCHSEGEPSADAVSACMPYLEQQIAIVQPEVIVALGGFAARVLLGSDRAMPRMRGEWQSRDAVAVLPTFHPIAVVQNPKLKAPVWADLKKVIRRLASPSPSNA